MVSADPTGGHDWHSDAYVEEWIETQNDEERAKLLRRMAYLIPFDPEEHITALDIGGGYGLVTKAVAEAFPHARVVLHDYSEPMLAQAKARLSGLSDSVSYRGGDLMAPGWTNDLQGPFHAV